MYLLSNQLKVHLLRKNPTLVKLLRKHKINNEEIWNKILADGGSVQDIDELNDVTMGHDIPQRRYLKLLRKLIS